MVLLHRERPMTQIPLAAALFASIAFGALASSLLFGHCALYEFFDVCLLP